MVGTAVVSSQQADAATATAIYVNNMSGACSDTGTGTQAVPYCTIQEAANAASAGDTVLIAGSAYSYYGNTTIAHSGTAAALITFESTGAPLFSARKLTISGSYVVVSGGLFNYGVASPVVVTGSHVTLDDDRMDGGVAASSTVQVGAGVNGLTIKRSILAAWGNEPGIQLGSGDANTVLTTNVIETGWADLTPPTSLATADYPAISASSDSNTEITGNTIVAQCFTGITVNGSTGTSIENNIISAESCQTKGRTDIAVDGASAASTTESYNLLSTVSGGVTPYGWSGKNYSTQATFAAATGQGSADVVQSSVDVTTGGFHGAASGTANPAAPGELATDLYGDAWSGTSPDRGAVAQQEYSGANASLITVEDAPQQMTIALDLHGVAWGSSPTMTVDWGDGSGAQDEPMADRPVADFSYIPDYHMYKQRGTYTITVTLTDFAQTITRTATVTTSGDMYVPVTPTRVLDTRKGTGAAQAKLGSEASLPVNVTQGVTLPSGIGTITAVVMNVTVTNPTAGGNISAYPAGTSLPTTSNLNFAAGETVPNLVTVKVGTGDVVDLHNDSPGSTDLIADVEGYYVASASGGYYLPYSPQRILDTRKGTGATGPLASNGVVSFSVPQCVSGSGSSKVTAPAEAVALNVTVTSPAAGGHITAYPDQTTLPNSSNLNFTTGQTVPNLVVVKVGADGKVDLQNGSPGTAQLVADLEGCYSTLGDAFAPVTPYRALDTRTGLGQGTYLNTPTPAAPDSNVAWLSNDWDPTSGGSQGAVGVVMNVTVTQPKASGFITAYPSLSAMPNASNLNFTTGETVPNLVMVGFEPALYNNSKGSTQLIADVYGYFS
jgi:hypothetical protein